MRMFGVQQFPLSPISLGGGGGGGGGEQGGDAAVSLFIWLMVAVVVVMVAAAMVAALVAMVVIMVVAAEEMADTVVMLRFLCNVHSVDDTPSSLMVMLSSIGEEVVVVVRIASPNIKRCPPTKRFPPHPRNI